MSFFSLIRPRDDGTANQASDWGDRLACDFRAYGHSLVSDVDDTTPPDTANILAVLSSMATLVCYFGHGDEDSLLTGGSPTVDISSIRVATGIAIVSVACKTGNNLGPAAITAGADAWLGFTVKVPVIAPHRSIDTIGDAIVEGIKGIAGGDTMQQVKDSLRQCFDQLMNDYDTGSYCSHPAASLGYYCAMALRDHLVLHGNPSCIPL